MRATSTGMKAHHHNALDYNSKCKQELRKYQVTATGGYNVLSSPLAWHFIHHGLQQRTSISDYATRKLSCEQQGKQ